MKLKELYHQFEGALSWLSPYHMLNCVSATALVLGTPVFPTIMVLNEEVKMNQLRSKDIFVVFTMAIIWVFWLLIVCSFYNHVIVMMLLTYLVNIATILFAAGVYA